ncbi:DUF1016 N-terminal domain-containing protein [Allorhodopirellula solitaria]|uniref:YhcG N-terminal domain-containing protein n=1 Tax=Allorhodopirellula solitaria TaxID=2527987 RepID=A0A5C5YG76_9BACT|nr:DUF1016 N-terminal domain-containing protein [Allorhodopirellula solitaria]TWT73969.1 hypothetical protein CA85_08520 [Allorhodopirellula solitaria]
MKDESELAIIDSDLLPEVRRLIDESRRRAAVVVNAELTMLYWDVGATVRDVVMAGKRAKYGKRVIERLAERLTKLYGKGWTQTQLRHCLRTVEAFPDREIVYALRTHLSWTHFRALIFIENPLHAI